MTSSLVDQSLQLSTLLTCIPTDNSYKSISQLNLVLSKYIKILDYVNSYNPEYRSATRIYYADISVIRDHIQEVLTAASYAHKERAFENAKNELTADLHALSMLIKPQEAFAE